LSSRPRAAAFGAAVSDVAALDVAAFWEAARFAPFVRETAEAGAASSAADGADERGEAALRRAVRADPEDVTVGSSVKPD